MSSKCFLLLSVVLYSLAAPGTSLAEAPVVPLKHNPDAPTHRERSMQFWAWFRTKQMAAFEARTQGQLGEAGGGVWVSKALEALASGSALDEAPQLLIDASAVIRLGFDDLLFDHLHAKLSSHSRLAGGVEAIVLEKVSRTVMLPSSRDLPPSLLFNCALDYIVHCEAARREPFLCHSVAAASFLASSINAGDYPDDGGVVLAMQICSLSGSRWLDEGARGVLRREIKPGAAVPEWVGLLIEGMAEIRTGWRDRGTGYAQSVSEAGWKGFEAHLIKARTALHKAWELRPDCPEAAAMMVIIAKAGHAAAGETPRLWLERSLQACIDDPNSLGEYVDSLRKRWGGSCAALIRFASECAATGRFDTRLADTVIHTFVIASEETMDPDPDCLLKNPAVSGILLKAAKGRAEAPALVSRRHTSLSEYAACARQCERYDEAAAALAALTKPLHPLGARRVAALDLDERRLRLEVEALRSPAGPRLAELRKQRRMGGSAAVLPEYTGLLEKLPPDAATARAWLELCKSECAFEAAVHAGKWAAVPDHKDLRYWVQRAGEWQFADGCLATTTGIGGTARLVLGSSLPAHYEYELVLEREGPAVFHPAGFATAYHYDTGRTDHYEGFGFSRKGNPAVFRSGCMGDDVMYVDTRTMEMEVPRRFDLKGSYRREIISCTLNGQQADSQMPTTTLASPFNRFAICCSCLAPGESLRVVSLRFRGIPAR